MSERADNHENPNLLSNPLSPFTVIGCPIQLWLRADTTHHSFVLGAFNRYRDDPNQIATEVHLEHIYDEAYYTEATVQLPDALIENPKVTFESLSAMLYSLGLTKGSSEATNSLKLLSEPTDTVFSEVTLVTPTNEEIPTSYISIYSKIKGMHTTGQYPQDLSYDRHKPHAVVENLGRGIADVLAVLHEMNGGTNNTIHDLSMCVPTGRPIPYIPAGL